MEPYSKASLNLSKHTKPPSHDYVSPPSGGFSLTTIKVYFPAWLSRSGWISREGGENALMGFVGICNHNPCYAAVVIAEHEAASHCGRTDFARVCASDNFISDVLWSTLSHASVLAHQLNFLCLSTAEILIWIASRIDNLRRIQAPLTKESSLKVACSQTVTKETFFH